MTLFLIVIISIAAGVTNVVSRNINSMLAERIGLFSGTFFNYATGLVFSGILLVLNGEFLKLSSVYLKSVPFLAYLGGLVGVIVVSLSSFIAPKISSFYMTLLMFLGQLFAGIAIDYFTLGIMSKGKIIGGLLVMAGLTVNLLIDMKSSK